MKNILITGGNKGLGAAISKVLLDNGYVLYCLSRSETTDANLKNHENYHWFSFDLEDTQNLEKHIKSHKILGDIAFDCIL